MSDSSARPSRAASLFAELRRRRVFRTSAIYVAAAWLIIQVIDTTFPIFDLPDTYTRIVTVALIAGFPVVVVLSWVFDIGPPTVTRTPESGDVAEPATLAFTVQDQPAPDRSIAVMPFANLGNEPDSEFFSDGMSEELLNMLSRVPDLKVPARTSSFALRDSGADARTVSARLGVKHLLEGSVRRFGQRVRISAHLIDAQSGYTLWSSQYDRDLDDIFAVQDDIATSIVEALKSALNWQGETRAARRESAPTGNIEAYQFYLRGLYLWQRRGRTAIEGAIGVLQQAVELDPEFADALTLLATVQAALHEYSGSDREEGFAIAEPLARRSLAVEPDRGMPHAVLGYMAMRRWDWSPAIEHFQNALAAEAGDPTIHLWYSNLLNDLADRERAVKEAQTAWQLDRLSPQANNVLALNYVLLRRDEAASKHVAIAREFGIGGPVPDFVDYFVALRRKEFEQAAEVMQKSLERRRQDTAWLAPTINALADTSERPAAASALADALARNAISPALGLMQYVLLGLGDETFALAETLLDGQRLTHLWLLLPEAQPMQGDPRFLDLMARMGIVDYWNEAGWPAAVAALRSGTPS